jgi:hypothetical protein
MITTEVLRCANCNGRFERVLPLGKTAALCLGIIAVTVFGALYRSTPYFWVGPIVFCGFAIALAASTPLTPWTEPTRRQVAARLGPFLTLFVVTMLVIGTMRIWVPYLLGHHGL